MAFASTGEYFLFLASLLREDKFDHFYPTRTELLLLLVEYFSLPGFFA